MTFNPDEWRAGMERSIGPDWRKKMKEWSSNGGRAKVNKGIGTLTPERRAEISRLGVEARRRKNGTGNKV